MMRTKINASWGLYSVDYDDYSTLGPILVSPYFGKLPVTSSWNPTNLSACRLSGPNLLTQRADDMILVSRRGGGGGGWGCTKRQTKVRV